MWSDLCFRKIEAGMGKSVGGRKRGTRGKGPGKVPGNTTEERWLSAVRNGQRGIVGRNCWKNG